MRFTAALALAAVPAALGKAINNVFPDVEERSSHQVAGNAGQVVPGLTVPAGAQVIVIWANPGGVAATTTINQAITVTQTVTAGATNTAAPAAPPGAIPTHHVTVGGTAGLVFTPAEIQAAVGDMVVFTFLSKNHTATQSSFAKPCEPLAGGQASGFQPNPDDSIVPAPQVAMQVMTTEPLWFFCNQPGHCGKGMVFSVNPTAEKTHAAFQAAAIAQAGKGASSPITGGAPVAPPAAAAPANGTAPVAPPAESAAPGGATGTIETGTGTIQDGQCICAVQCSAANFPAADLQGRGNFGGFAGALPASMMEA
ncbi:uncharacterized protein B0I36DRAFT_310777 [Microdochium trichocladiopsis]|uniref:Cupredoxin n=1 Tax=Microdochium trichocladiopsis TaxID=1682393 RepID=A0A9P9BW63_9PEZI|nr:uncharacterized protein B0I36DRAFT_310777 [Microdochium trichocladiopsis]KAH7040482.1 hypothetical protein B0I36DRAFT_310777 [Microdochium trichocladiopsis]